MYTVLESGGYVEVCVQTNSTSDILPSGGFVTFSVDVTASTAGERHYLTQNNTPLTQGSSCCPPLLAI